MRSLEAEARKWVDLVSEIIVKHDFRVVGCTSTFQQILSSISLLNRIKLSRPEVVAILGGANCSGDMAKGILSLGFSVDYIFSGESEKTFPNFLKQIREGLHIYGSIIEEDIVLDLDEIPTPNYSEFFSQIESWLPGGSTFTHKNAWLPYECSRGCFWGRCKFCGACGKSKRFRQKSPEHVFKELKTLLKYSINKNISMVDNIMPNNFLETLIPNISEEIPELNIFCEQKSNHSLDQIIALKKAGVNVIQSGIESISTDCLDLMDKGVNASQNIALLRYARSLDMIVKWNFLYGFPGDNLKEYKLMADMLPMLLHLNPPVGLSCLNIQRFSIYFDQPNDYGISNIRPFKAYSSIFPEDIDLKNIAYHFLGDYRSDSIENPEIMKKISNKISIWRHYLEIK
jgi:ribosomal peptide maturation radical SAM protein 1